MLSVQQHFLCAQLCINNLKTLQMKKIFNISNLFIFLLVVFTGCEDDPILTQQEVVMFSEDITVSDDNIVLLKENATDVVISITWPEVKYSVDAPVSYTVHMTQNEDWANAYSINAGNDIYSTSLTTEALNTIALEELGLEGDKEATLSIRVEAYLNQRVYSSVEKIMVTPYVLVEPYITYPSLYIAGDYQGWNIKEGDSISSVEDNGVYEGYIYIPPGGTNEFKLYAQKDWAPMSYGNGGDGELIEANYAGANFIAPSDGYYLFAVDLNTMKYILIGIDSWGIMGEATPDGWNSDTDLTFDATTELWSLTADLKSEGTFKIRANNDWKLDFALNEDGKLTYVNHPWLPYGPDLHFTVEQDGNYTITLDLTIPGNYRYSIIAN